MAKKSLGQNFLFDPAILGRIIEVAGIGTDDTAVEIGPGPGRLTLLLSKVAKKVVAIELDSDLYIKLQDELAGRENVELVLGDDVSLQSDRKLDQLIERGAVQFRALPRFEQPTFCDLA